jgi:ribosome-binding factor A
VWVSVIGNDEERRATLRALGHAMPYVRARLGKLRLRRIPELHVKLDTTAERGTRLLRILEDIGSGREPVDGERRETLPTPGIRPADETTG